MARTIAAFLVLALAYNWAVVHFSPPADGGPDVLTNNLLIAERFLYARQPQQVVLAGSSMSALLPAKALGPRLCNLSILGGGPLTGLSIIARSHRARAPALVLIETNEFVRDPDQRLLEHLFGQPGQTLRAWLPLMRISARPMAILTAWVKPLPSQAPPGPVPTARLAGLKAEYDGLPDATMVQHRLELLAGLIDALARRGTKVAFFELPAHTVVCNSPRARLLRSAIQKRFAPPAYPWLAMPDCAATITSDGVHLPPAGAVDQALRLRRWVQGLMSRP